MARSVSYFHISIFQNFHLSRNLLALLAFRFCGVAVVLFVVYLLAVSVFFPVGLLSLLRGQGASIGGALVVYLLIQRSLAAVRPGSFAGCHLPAAQTVCCTLLLVGLPVVDLVRSYCVRVVFFVVDLSAGVVLLAVDLLTFLTGQPATVGRAIVVYLLIDARLRAIGASRFAGGHLSTAQPVGNALVLIRFAVIGIVVAPD